MDFPGDCGLNLNAPSLPVAMLAQGMTLLHLDQGSLEVWPQWEGSLLPLSFLLLVHRTERDKCQQRWSQTPWTCPWTRQRRHWWPRS